MTFDNLRMYKLDAGSSNRMTKAKDIFGKAYKNARKRFDKDSGTSDPAMIGWIDFPNGRANLAMFLDTFDENDPDSKIITAVNAWSAKSGSYQPGMLKVNRSAMFEHSPNLIGKQLFDGVNYTVACWINRKESNDPFFKATLKLSGNHEESMNNMPVFDAFV